MTPLEPSRLCNPRLLLTLALAVSAPACTAAQMEQLRAELERSRESRDGSDTTRTPEPPTAPNRPTTPTAVAPEPEPATPPTDTPTEPTSHPDDHCGPEFIQKALPRWLAQGVQDAIARDLKPSCQKHDACYRAKVSTQRECDDLFLEDMKRRCAEVYGTRWLGIPARFCLGKALIFYDLVASTTGAYAYGKGPIDGRFVSHRQQVKRAVFGDDELEVCVTLENPTQRVLEYEVRLFSEDWRLVDIEPDTHEVNIAPGTSRELCLGTSFNPAWSIRNLGRQVHLVAFVDDPDSWKVVDDMIVVDHQTYRLP